MKNVFLPVRRMQQKKKNGNSVGQDPNIENTQGCFELKTEVEVRGETTKWRFGSHLWM